jgi:succinate dehydrogenase / fumarate reductase flavoprotein subunit
MECTVVTLLHDGERIAGALAYDRERGRFKVFRAKAVVLATGGIGRAYSISSNSWEYTGDGHALAYLAGAALQDMEFVQFHPDRDDLAAERARHPRDGRSARRGGRAEEPRRPAVHVRQHPDNYKSQTADSEEEGWSTRRATRTPGVLPSC